MSYRNRRKIQVSSWKVLRRCVVFFTAVCVIPVMLVLLVVSDHYTRPARHESYVQQTMSRREETFFLEIPLNQDMVASRNRLGSRKEYLKKTCEKLGLDQPGNDTLHRPNPWEYLVDNKHHLVWCNVFKAGSTSWMYNFNVLAGYSHKFLKKTKSVPLSLARQKYPRPTVDELRQALNHSVSFLVARHPLERLLSAYRDKLQYSPPYGYYRKLGNEIVMKYRYKIKSKIRQRGLATRMIPTFPEFIEFLLDSVNNGEELDMHWTPITQFCTPCLFDIKIIAHTETLQEDQTYLIKLAHLDKIIHPEWKNAGKGTTSNEIAKYYSQLTRSQILKLAHLYRYDFDLFNYSSEGYPELGMPDDEPSSY